MRVTEYTKAMQAMQVPEDLERRLVRSVERRAARTKKLQPVTVLAPVCAVLLLFAVPFAAGRIGAYLSGAPEQEAEVTPFIRVSAADVDLSDAGQDVEKLMQDFGFETDGEGRIVCFPNLFLSIGEPDDPDIERVTLESESGVLTCYRELERERSKAESGAPWNKMDVMFPYGDWYKSFVNDPEVPTEDEAAAILNALCAEPDARAREHVQVTLDGQIQTEMPALDEAPNITEIRVMHKSDPNAGMVSITVENRLSTAPAPDFAQKTLDVIPYEEIYWSLPAETVEALRDAPADGIDFSAYNDTVRFTVERKDGATLTGSISIVFDAAGQMRTSYRVDQFLHYEF